MKTALGVLAILMAVVGSLWYQTRQPAFQTVARAIFNEPPGGVDATDPQLLILYAYRMRKQISDDVVHGCRTFHIYAYGKHGSRFHRATMQLDVDDERAWRLLSIEGEGEGQGQGNAECRIGLRSAKAAERVRRWIDEMPASPERQQTALDELSVFGDEGEGYLFAYLGDQRRLADPHLRFLNRRPGASRKYYDADGATVGEAVSRYLCWRSAACDPQTGFAGLVAARAQLLSYCRQDEACAARASLHLTAP